ncbi:unnamed protein product [Discosporangium mesarthrocarpum]
MEVADRVTEEGVKTILEEVLSQDSFAGKRAAQMDIDDLLELLAAFNAKGLHFA